MRHPIVVEPPGGHQIHGRPPDGRGYHLNGLTHLRAGYGHVVRLTRTDGQKADYYIGDGKIETATRGGREAPCAESAAGVDRDDRK